MKPENRRQILKAKLVTIAILVSDCQRLAIDIAEEPTMKSKRKHDRAKVARKVRKVAKAKVKRKKARRK